EFDGCITGCCYVWNTVAVEVGEGGVAEHLSHFIGRRCIEASVFPAVTDVDPVGSGGHDVGLAVAVDVDYLLREAAVRSKGPCRVVLRIAEGESGLTQQYGIPIFCIGEDVGDTVAVQVEHGKREIKGTHPVVLGVMVSEDFVGDGGWVEGAVGVAVEDDEVDGTVDVNMVDGLSVTEDG